MFAENAFFTPILVCEKSTGCLVTRPDQVQCEFCGEKVPEVRYNKHVLTFHKSGSEKPYQCHVCQKGFLESNHLKEHMNIHEGIKPFKCTLGCVDVAYARSRH